MALHLIPAGVTGGYTGIPPPVQYDFTPLILGVNALKFFGQKIPKS